MLTPWEDEPDDARPKRKPYVGCVLLRGVLKLKAGRKRLPNQRLFPAVAKRVSISVTPADRNSSCLRGHQQREINDIRRHVVAINHDGDSCFL